jgi:hypothetical protein
VVVKCGLFELFENEVLGKILKPKKSKVSGQFQILYDEELGSYRGHLVLEQ